jgi:hypothetical protein
MRAHIVLASSPFFHSTGDTEICIEASKAKTGTLKTKPSGDSSYIFTSGVTWSSVFLGHGGLDPFTQVNLEMCDVFVAMARSHRTAFFLYL